MMLWIGALVFGTVLGLLGLSWVLDLCDFVAAAYTRLFQLLAVPTIAVAVICTLSTLGSDKGTGKIFLKTITYTLLTTLAASLVGLLLYLVVRPDNLPSALLGNTVADSSLTPETSVYGHILNTIPNNIIRPILEGNVLSILIIAAAVGMALSKMQDSDSKGVLLKGLQGLQDLLFMLIKWLIATLPIGIVAFAAQLSSQFGSGLIAESLGKYVLVIIGGNLIQMIVVLPLFLLARGLNPLKVMKAMMPAVLMALFTKSSAATLPVTISSAEDRLGAKQKVSRFVLPICTTINMNGCAAFILVTSLFVMQNGGMVPSLSAGTMVTFFLSWVLISVVSAVGNAGVPMGCYFLTLSLMTGVGAPVAVMGLILPIYTIIDMIETAENVWSDSCVCAMVDASS